MPKTSPRLTLLLFFAAATMTLHADTYNYIISAGAANNDPAYNFRATGTFSGPVDPFDQAGLDINGITGSANGYDFLGVVAPGTTNTQNPASQFGYTFDNVVYPAANAAHVDETGLLLYLSSPMGTSLAHVYYTGITAQNPAGYVVDVVDPNEPGASTPFSVATSLGVRNFTLTRAAASPVPEPASLALLATGMTAMAGVLAGRRRVGKRQS
jgi:hypothetical protein